MKLTRNRKVTNEFKSRTKGRQVSAFGFSGRTSGRSYEASRKATKRAAGRWKKRLRILVIVLLLLLVISYIARSDSQWAGSLRRQILDKTGISRLFTEDWNGTSLSDGELPEYDGEVYCVLNGGEPNFPEEVYEAAGLDAFSDNLNSYEYYGELDTFGRCTIAYACLGRETMPLEYEERGDISMIHPSGWASGQGWERAHLIAWSLSAENANERNLVTGSHTMNYDGMRPFEESVARYIDDTGNHVLYMAKPCYGDGELVPRGVQIVAWSIEDQGRGISFNVYCFNIIPDGEIDYNTGVTTNQEQANQAPRLYVLNESSRKFHYPSCEGAKKIAEHNRKEVTATRYALTNSGYKPCGDCQP